MSNGKTFDINAYLQGQDLFDPNEGDRNGGGGNYAPVGYTPQGTTVFSIVFDHAAQQRIVEEANAIGVTDPNAASLHMRRNYHSQYSEPVRTVFVNSKTGEVSKGKAVLAWVIVYNAPANTKKLPAGWDGETAELSDFMKDRVATLGVGAARAVFPFEFKSGAFKALKELAGAYKDVGNTVDVVAQVGGKKEIVEYEYERFTRIDWESGEIIQPGLLFTVTRTGDGLETRYSVGTLGADVPVVTKATEVAIRNEHVAGAIVLPPTLSLREVADDYTRFQEDKLTATAGTGNAAQPDLDDEFSA